MRITVAAIGRLKSGPETDLSNRYIKRFDSSGRGLGLGPIKIHELPESREGNAGLRKKDEAGRLLQKLGDGAIQLALDEHGDSLTSTEFSELIAKQRDEGATELAFLIGGADGHGKQVLETARKMISLGAMTLPHGLARVVLLEQLYRAATILSGHPYHRA